ncbi:hypothetical protein ACWIGY_38010 [Streptomyces anulatus]
MPATDVWRSPGGQNFRRTWSEEPGFSVVTLQPAVYDPDTGQWSTDRDALPVTVDEAAFEEYVEVPPERLRDPRITRLTGLVHELLADYERSTGRPPTGADSIRAALDDVAEIPEEASRRRHAAARGAASAGFNRGRRR